MDTDLSLATSTKNPLLFACAPSTRVGLQTAGVVREFEADEQLIRDTEVAGVALFPLRGSLQFSKATQRGRRQIFCNTPTHSCGGICMLAFGERAVADVWGMTRGAVLVVPRGEFLPLVRQDPVLCQAAWNSVIGCMAHLSDLVTQLSFNTVAERVATALLNGTQASGEVVRLTQAELAAEVGTTREVVARCLADLQASGAIRLGRGRITVLDRDRLGN